MSDKGIAAALVEAQGHARALFKEAENQHHRYTYVSAEQVIDEARRALSKAGLAFIQVSDRLNRSESRGDGVIGTAECEYKLVHNSGQEMAFKSSMPVIISKGRPDDKAYAAALTLTLAYTLRGLLLIPRDDNAAAIDQRDDTQFDPAEAQRQLAERYVDDIAQARGDELEELRESAKRELQGEALQLVGNAYKKRVLELRGTQKQAPPANQTDLPARHNEATRAIARAKSAADVDAVMRDWANAPEAVRADVYVSGFKKLFELADNPGDLGSYAAAIADADLDQQSRKELREAYQTRLAELKGRAA